MGLVGRPGPFNRNAHDIYRDKDDLLLLAEVPAGPWLGRGVEGWMTEAIVATYFIELLADGRVLKLWMPFLQLTQILISGFYYLRQLCDRVWTSV